MISVLYVHDFPIKVDFEEHVYFSVGLPESYFDRFKNVAYKTDLVSRKELVSDVSNLTVRKEKFLQLSGLSDYSYFGVFVNLFKYRKTVKNYDLVVMNYPAIISIFMLLFIRPKNYVIEHVNDDSSFSSKRFGVLITFLLNVFKNKFFGHAKGVLAVSEYLRNDSYPEFSRVASNVHLSDMSRINRQPIKEDESIEILTVGAISKKKGIDLAIKALSKYKRPFKYHLVGEKNDIDILDLLEETGMTNNVVLHGVLSPEQVKEKMKSCHLYIQPSRAEGLPRATIEAMSYSLPCLVSRHNCFEELIEGEYRINWDDDFSFLEAISKLIENGEYVRVSDRNYNISENYSYSQLLEIKCKFYKEVVDGLSID